MQKGKKHKNALCRIRKWKTIEKARILNNAYILSLFYYCPIVWVRVVYNSDDKSFEELLQINGSVTIHQRNLRTLMIEVYKSINIKSRICGIYSTSTTQATLYIRTLI